MLFRSVPVPRTCSSCSSCATASRQAALQGVVGAGRRRPCRRPCRRGAAVHPADRARELRVDDVREARQAAIQAAMTSMLNREKKLKEEGGAARVDRREDQAHARRARHQRPRALRVVRPRAPGNRAAVRARAHARRAPRLERREEGQEVHEGRRRRRALALLRRDRRRRIDRDERRRAPHLHARRAAAHPPDRRVPAAAVGGRASVELPAQRGARCTMSLASSARSPPRRSNCRLGRAGGVPHAAADLHAPLRAVVALRPPPPRRAAALAPRCRPRRSHKMGRLSERPAPTARLWWLATSRRSAG